jgi:cytochrome P450
MQDSMSSVAADTIADRVSADRLVDFNVYNPDPEGAGYDEAWLAFRDRSKPIMWTSANGGHWIATTGDLIRSILADHEHFSSRVLMAPREFGISKLIPVGSDPPDHLYYRALINRAFSPAAVRRTTDFIRSYAGELIDRTAPRGACEFMTDFARRLPIDVFFKLADLPLDDHERLERFLGQLLHPDHVDAQDAGFQSFADYLAPIIEERRRRPGDDVLSAIVSGTVNNRPVTQDEAINMCTSLIIGGLDTTLALMAFSMRHLATDTGLRHLLADSPDRIPEAVEEFARRFPIGVNTREVREDYEVDGVLLKAGELITTPQILHAFDELEYPNPLKVDIDRNTGGNSAFGHGIHRCPGSFLAKTELRILIEEWLKRIRDFEVEPGARIIIDPGISSTIRQLPLRWSPAA